MNLIERTTGILLRPKETWPLIDAEPATVGSIYSNWLIIMAAIPAVCGFIGLSLIGVGAFGFGYRMPIVGGIVMAVVGYVLSLAVTYVMALVVDALAPSFGGTKNPVGALKVMAYGATAVYVAGILKLLPSLGMLGIIAGCYSIYLMYLGLQSVMKSPQDKAVGYTAVVVIIFVVASIVVGSITALFIGFGALSSFGSRQSSAFSINTPNGSVNIDTTAIDAASKRIEAAQAQADAAQKSGDPASATAALGAMMGALTGAGGTPIPVADLKAQLPTRSAPSSANRSRPAAAPRWASPAPWPRPATPTATSAPSSRSPTSAASGAWPRWRPGPTSPSTRRHPTASRRPTRTAAARSTRNTARTAATPK